MDLWNLSLDFLSQFVTPLWSTLLQYIPLLLLMLTVVTVLGLARAWAHNSARNASRVPRPVPAGPVPDGVHMPSGSPWPFVAPVGLLLIFFALAIGGGDSSPVNIPIALVGGLIGVTGAIGWFLDARREYDQLDAHDHGLRLAAEADGTHEPAPVVIPDGIHLPGPSPWPFLAPIGLFFIFLGLVLGPLLIVAGLVMGAAAAIGWFIDANREFVQVEAGHEAEPLTRDPVKVFPHKLVPVFVTVAAIAVVLTLGPWLLTFLPQQAVAGDDGPPATTTPHVSASSVLGFDQTRFVIPADTPTQLTFENKQAGVDHDVAIFADAAKTETTFDGEPIKGVAQIVYDLPPMPAGSYPFICTIHPTTMIGTVLVKAGPVPAPSS